MWFQVPVPASQSYKQTGGKIQGGGDPFWQGCCLVQSNSQTACWEGSQEGQKSSYVCGPKKIKYTEKNLTESFQIDNSTK